jgi:hypothetical protein
MLVTTALTAALSVASAGAGGSPVDGRWSWNWTLAQMLHCNGNAALAGPSLSEFRDGRIYALDPSTDRVIGLRGRYTVAGKVVSLVFSHHYPGSAPIPGKTYMMRFSIFRNRLTWSMVPGRSGLTCLPIVPWVRVG